MPVSGADPLNAWELRYQQGDTGWDRGCASPVVHEWFAKVEPCRVLVPGCGRGYEVVLLARLGFDVTAIDIAPSAIAALQQQLTTAAVSATLICGDLFDYQSETGFDAIFEQTCLCAIDPGQRIAYEHCIRSCLRPAGSLYALFMQTGQTGGPPFDCSMPDMRQLFDTQYWEWPEHASARVERNGEKYELGYILTRK